MLTTALLSSRKSVGKLFTRDECVCETLHTLRVKDTMYKTNVPYYIYIVPNFEVHIDLALFANLS